MLTVPVKVLENVTSLSALVVVASLKISTALVPGFMFTLIDCASPKLPTIKVLVCTAVPVVATQFTTSVPVMVIPVTVVVSKIVVLTPVNVMLPVPKASTLVLVLLELNSPVDNVKVLSDMVPAVSVQVPAAVHSVGLPDNDRVMSALLIVVLKDTAVDVTVTVAAVPELASKVTESALVGSKTVGAPPVVTANCVFPVPLQVPVPPTQKYAAICYPKNFSLYSVRR